MVLNEQTSQSRGLQHLLWVSSDEHVINLSSATATTQVFPKGVLMKIPLFGENTAKSFGIGGDWKRTTTIVLKI